MRKPYTALTELTKQNVNGYLRISAKTLEPLTEVGEESLVHPLPLHVQSRGNKMQASEPIYKL